MDYVKILLKLNFKLLLVINLTTTNKNNKINLLYIEREFFLSFQYPFDGFILFHRCYSFHELCSLII